MEINAYCCATTFVVFDSQVVLNLRYWSNNEEWKMTRFQRPLASGTAVVVSERCGSEKEQAQWGKAVSDSFLLLMGVMTSQPTAALSSIDFEMPFGEYELISR